VQFKARFSMLTALLVDNLPVAAMSAMGASTIFACDVGSVRRPIAHHI
jgi:predicted acylesterase/phospholipase RssA